MGSFATRDSKFIYSEDGREEILLDLGDYFSNKGRVPFHSDLTDVTIPNLIVAQMDRHEAYCAGTKQEQYLHTYTMLDVMLVAFHVKSKYPKRVLELCATDTILSSHWSALLAALHPESVLDSLQADTAAKASYDLVVLNVSEAVDNPEAVLTVAASSVKEGGELLCLSMEQPKMEQLFVDSFSDVIVYRPQEGVAILRTLYPSQWKTRSFTDVPDREEQGYSFDTLIMTTAADYRRLQRLYPKLEEHIRYGRGRIAFVGSDEIAELVGQTWNDPDTRVTAIPEDSILPFDTVHGVMKEKMAPVLRGRELPRGITGWYYQQFLKWEYAKTCKKEYYLVWDGDTIPCRPLSVFKAENGKPYLDMKHEHHQPYFDTIGKILPGMEKVIGRSFISEHMLLKTEIVLSLIADIEKNRGLKGDSFWEKILDAVPPEKIQESAFSEFETYGTYVAFRYPSVYMLREWHSFRLGGEFFEIDEISDRDFSWLGKDFDAISFEKGMTVREDHRNLFDNPEYQGKLTAKQMLQSAQEAFTDGYIEVWGEQEGQSANINAGAYNVTAAMQGKLRDLTPDTWRVYEELGDGLCGVNDDQAYLCYENAAFLCEDSAGEKARLREKAQAFAEAHTVRVRKTAIVILSYNNQYLMQKCLESIRTHCNPALCQVVVLDNASTDGVTDWLRKQNDITLVCSDENLGFPAGCNRAICDAPTDADIFLLNNDTRMTPNALFWLQMALYESGDTGASGSITNYAAEHQRVDVEFPMPEDYVAYGAKINVPPVREPEESKVLSGFALLVKRTVWEEAGALDEAFSPGYLEDTDLCIRIRKAGYRLLLCRNSFIYHAGSQSFMERGDTEALFDRNFNYLCGKWGEELVTEYLA